LEKRDLMITTIVAEARWRLRECARLLEEQSVALREAGYHAIHDELLKTSERVTEIRDSLGETLTTK
jgi:hypothetical protein